MFAIVAGHLVVGCLGYVFVARLIFPIAKTADLPHEGLHHSGGSAHIKQTHNGQNEVQQLHEGWLDEEAP
jgi:hypothetical protein